MTFVLIDRSLSNIPIYSKGIDFGNLQSKIAVARNRGIDVICNEVSNRATPYVDLRKKGELYAFFV